MCDFRIGDDVAVVDEGSGVGPAVYRFVVGLFGGDVVQMDRGAVFRIEDMMRHPILPWVIGLWLEGRFAWHPHFWFRKVQRRDLTVWLSTENTIEEPKRAPAEECV